MIRHMCLPLAIVFATSAGCSERPSPQPSTQQAGVDALSAGRIPVSDEPPAALLQLGQSAADLFDGARSSDWRQASASLRALNEAVSNLPANLPDPDLVSKLRSRLVSVGNATNGQRRLEAMEGANATTQIVAELSLKYRSEVPYEVKILGYYGRQIEVGVASGDSTVTRRAATDLMTTWNRIEPVVERRAQPDAARRFSDIVMQLMEATQPADLSASAEDEVAVARDLERIFAK